MAIWQGEDARHKGLCFFDGKHMVTEKQQNLPPTNIMVAYEKNNYI